MYNSISNVFKIVRKLIIVLFIIIFIVSIKTRIIVVGSVYVIVFSLCLILLKYLECLFIYFDTKDNKELKNSINYYFMVYLLLLFYALFLDRNLNLLNFKNWFSHLNLSNLIPFSSIISIVKNAFCSGNYESLSIILGNLIMLSPMAFFIPRLLKNNSNNSFKKFLAIIVLFSLFIEIFQLVTDTGYFDIDDIILNVVGTILFYYCFNKTFFVRILNNLFFLEGNKLLKKEIESSILIIVLTLLVFAIAIYNYYSEPVGSYMEIICEKGDCEGGDTFLYDDGNYLYYVKGDCIDDLYIDFKKDKYLLKDYLNGLGRKVYYKFYTIKDIQLRYSNFIDVESKYYETSFTYPSREVIFDYEVDDEFLEVESFDSYITPNDFTDYYRVKGKKSGETLLRIIIRNYFNYDEIFEIVEIEYEINDDLKVFENNIEKD